MNEIKKIKSLRNQKGISQTKMASKVGLSQPGYAKIESGVTENMSLSLAIKISKVLEIGFNELYDIDGDSQKIDSLNNEIEILKKRIVELEEQLDDKRKANLSNEETIKYWNLFAKYSREIQSENKNISANELENLVMMKIYKNDGPFIVKVDNEKNWSFSFRGEK